MLRIVERPKALEDLDGITDYIAADNPEAARRVIAAVADTYRHLAEWPEMSQILAGGFRMMPVVLVNTWCFTLWRGRLSKSCE